jgi:hypothetical protein
MNKIIIYEDGNVQKMHFANSNKSVKFYNLDIVLAKKESKSNLEGSGYEI